jgi:hypothetical protein
MGVSEAIMARVRQLFEQGMRAAASRPAPLIAVGATPPSVTLTRDEWQAITEEVMRAMAAEIERLEALANGAGGPMSEQRPS